MCDTSRCTSAATLMCNRCKTARYCSKECQVADWPAHKLVCGPRATRIAAAPEDGDAPVTTVRAFGPYVLTYYPNAIESDDNTLPIFSIKLGSEWTETFKLGESNGVFGMYYDKQSIERVRRLRKFVEATADAEDGEDNALYVVRDVADHAFIVYNEEDIAAYFNQRVWFVDDPPKVLKWVTKPRGSNAYPGELSIAQKLGRTAGVSVAPIIRTIESLVNPRSPVENFSAMLMPKYPHKTLTGWLEQHSRTHRELLHLASQALIELARIQRVYPRFQHGDMHGGNIFVDETGVCPSTDDFVGDDAVQVPPLSFGRLVLFDFGRSTLEYVLTSGGRSKTISYRPNKLTLPDNEDAKMLFSSLGRWGGGSFSAKVTQHVVPTRTYSQTVALIRAVWADAN